MLIPAKVVKQTRDKVELISVQRDCGSCKSCQPPPPETFIVKTRRKYKKGQTVNVRLNTCYFWRALGLLIFLPLLTLVVVLNFLLKSGLPEISAVLVSLLICFLEYICIYFYDRTIQTADLYKIVA